MVARHQKGHPGGMKHDLMSREDGGEKQARAMFVNYQWALGVPGSGAPTHYHNIAWNGVVYGAKRWFISPPRHWSNWVSWLQLSKFLGILGNQIVRPLVITI